MHPVSDTKIAFIIVTYNEVFYNSVSYKTFIEPLLQTGYLNWELLIYDNSDIDGWKVDYDFLSIKNKIYYHGNPNNPGLSVAYNYMARYAEKKGIEWIILMDQDTSFPINAFQTYLSAIENSNDIYIKAPIVYTGNFIFSPMRRFFVKTFKREKIIPGIYNLNRYLIINSGLLINVKFFWKIGGYNEKVRVDFSDVNFINRARKETVDFSVLSIICKQHFSYYENIDMNKAIKRYQQYLIDHYNCEKTTLGNWGVFFLEDLIHLKRLLQKFKSYKFIKIYILFLLSKKRGHFYFDK